LVFPATVLYRWFNRESTCNAFFNEPELDGISTFERYIKGAEFGILNDCLNRIPTPHVTGAFIINGKPGYHKGLGVLVYFHEWFTVLPWRDQWELWMAKPPKLEQIYKWIRSDGLGSFMRGQIVADLKYLPSFEQESDDWWDWAAPGPGSMRGLNVVLGRDFNKAWREDAWLNELCLLNTLVTPKLQTMGIGRLHNQDLQNCLCEFSKYTKVMYGWGRPRQVYHHV